MSSAYLPGAASLADHLDKKIAVLLQDGRYLIGNLRSYDQYMNVILHHTIERQVIDDLYRDTFVGVYIVRGENIVLFGELDESVRVNLHQIPSTDEFEKIVAQKTEKKKESWDTE